MALLQFRVIAVGDRFKRQVATEADAASGGQGSYVTIAVKQQAKDPPRATDPVDVRQSRRMIRVVTQRATGGRPAAEDRIFGVAVFPRGQAAAVPPGGDSPIEQPLGDEMLLTVPLEGIESVPDVILVGGNIGFFMLPEYP